MLTIIESKWGNKTNTLLEVACLEKKNILSMVF